MSRRLSLSSDDAGLTCGFGAALRVVTFPERDDAEEDPKRGERDGDALVPYVKWAPPLPDDEDDDVRSRAAEPKRGAWEPYDEPERDDDPYDEDPYDADPYEEDPWEDEPYDDPP